MLNINNFSRLSCGDGIDILFYEGDKHYSIFRDETGYALFVEDLDGDGEIVSEVYSCSSVSSAIAQIEEMEGE